MTRFTKVVFPAWRKGDATQAIRIFEQLSNMNRQESSRSLPTGAGLFALREDRHRRGQPEGDRGRREPAE